MAVAVLLRMGQTRVLIDLLVVPVGRMHGTGATCPNDSMEKMNLPVPHRNLQQYGIYLPLCLAILNLPYSLPSSLPSPRTTKQPLWLLCFRRLLLTGRKPRKDCLS